MTSGLFAPPSSSMHWSGDAEPSWWARLGRAFFRGISGPRFPMLALLSMNASTHFLSGSAWELLVALALL
jgi:hypothetical protein